MWIFYPLWRSVVSRPNARMNHGWANQQLLVPGRTDAAILRFHHGISHARVNLKIVELVEPNEGQMEPDICQVFPNAVSRAITKRPRHIPHLGCGVKPPSRNILGRVGEDLRITSRRVGRGGHLNACRNIVIADDLPWGYAWESSTERPP